MSSRFRLKHFITLAIFVTLAGCAVESDQKPSSSGITEAELKGHVRFLSDDMLEGRGTGARGGELAAKYIAAQLEAIGAKGAGANGSFFQAVALRGGTAG